MSKFEELAQVHEEKIVCRKNSNTLCFISQLVLLSLQKKVVNCILKNSNLDNDMTNCAKSVWIVYRLSTKPYG